MFGIPLTRITIIAVAVLALVAFISIKSCSSSRQEAAQARQDARSADAYAGAAKDAVAVVSARSEGEAKLKEVVAVAAKDIANAEGSDQPIPPAARAAALRGACQLPNYRHEPACAMLRTDP